MARLISIILVERPVVWSRPHQAIPGFTTLGLSAFESWYKRIMHKLCNECSNRPFESAIVGTSLHIQAPVFSFLAPTILRNLTSRTSTSR